MAKKLTDRGIKALRPQEAPYEIRDEEVPGLLVRVQPTGRRTFFFGYRTNSGRQNRVKLGVYGEVSLPRARSMAKEYAGKVAAGGDPAAERKAARKAEAEAVIQSMTLRDFLENEYTPWARLHLKSHESVMARLKGCFLPLLDKSLGSLEWKDFEAHRLHRLKNKLATKSRPATQAGVNRDLQHMRAALYKAVSWGKLAENPLAGMKLAKEDRNQKIRSLTHAEEAAILAVFEARRKKLAEEAKHLAPHYPTFLEPAFILALDTGIRRGELLSLTWENLDLEARTLTLKGIERQESGDNKGGTKSSQSREIPLSGRVIEALKRWRRQTKSKTGPVFGDATRDALKGQWKRLMKEAGITDLRWHDLRHTFCTRGALLGAPIVVLKELMGHADIQTTQRYLHATAKDKRAWIERMEAALNAEKQADQAPKSEAD